MRKSPFESQRDALERSRECGCAVEGISQFSVGDVGAAQSVALCSRDLEFDVAPEDLGDRSVPDRPAELAPRRLIHVDARHARRWGVGGRELPGARAPA